MLIDKLRDLMGEPWLEDGAYLVWNIGDPLPPSTRLPVIGATWEKQTPSKLEQRLMELDRMFFENKRNDL